MAKDCEDAARGVDGITNSEGAGAGWGQATTALATSDGFAGSYTGTSFSVSCAVIGGEGDMMERDYASHSARHLTDLDAPADIGLRAATRTIERLNPRKIESTKTNVVYHPRVSASLLGHLAGAITGFSIARGTSFLRDEMGKQIMSDAITVCDDPCASRELRSAGFDGEGVATEMLTPVENGVLKCWFLDSSSARQLALETNGVQHAVPVACQALGNQSLYAGRRNLRCQHVETNRHRLLCHGAYRHGCKWRHRRLQSRRLGILD